MSELTNFEKDICAIYAKYHHFPVDDIEFVFKRLQSFDNTLFAIQMTMIFNISLMEATEFFCYRNK